MKFEVGDIVYISIVTSLYRITEVHDGDKYSTNWLGNFNKNVPQACKTHGSSLILFKKASKLEKAMQ